MAEHPAQAEHVRARLLDVDEHRVEPLDLRERVGLRRGHQCADREQRAADAAADRRGDGGELQVDPRGLERSAGLRDGRLRLARRGDGVGVILPADRLGIGERLVTLGLDAGGFGAGLRALEVGGGLGSGGAIDARVDLVERLTGADQRAFSEQPAADDAANLRADVRALEGGGAAGQLGGDRGRNGLDGDEADGGGARRATRTRFALCAVAGVAAPAGGEKQCGGECDRVRRAQRLPR